MNNFLPILTSVTGHYTCKNLDFNQNSRGGHRLSHNRKKWITSGWAAFARTTPNITNFCSGTGSHFQFHLQQKKQSKMTEVHTNTTYNWNSFFRDDIPFAWCRFAFGSKISQCPHYRSYLIERRLKNCNAFRCFQPKRITNPEMRQALINLSGKMDRLLAEVHENRRKMTELEKSMIFIAIA